MLQCVHLQDALQVQALDVSLEPGGQTRQHGGSPAQHNVLVQCHSVVHIHVLHRAAPAL